MERGDLLRAAGLYQQIREVEHALDLIERRATITAVTMTVPPSEEETSGPRDPEVVTIPTADFQYPPQMTAAIKTQLEERLAALDNELANLGVQAETR